MARRRGAVTEDVDDGPALITLDEQHEAIRSLNHASGVRGRLTSPAARNSGAHIWPWDWGKR
jgi:hypothetical protein